MELLNLPAELIDEIFKLVPLKPLIRSKLVSKSWKSFITQFRLKNPPFTNSAVLVFHKTLNTSKFLKFLDDEVKITTAPKFDMPSNIHLVDACNRALLFATSESGFWVYHVCVPFSSKFTSLPLAHNVSRSACASLAFNEGLLQLTNFRVVCFFFEEYDSGAETLNYLCFSSDSWKWTEKQARLVNARTVIDDNFVPGHCFRPSVYMDKKLYWLWSLALLVFDENEEFHLVKLPGGEKIQPTYQLIFKSEKQIQYCFIHQERIQLWEYRGEIVTCSSDWIFKKIVEFNDLRLLQSELVFELTDADKQTVLKYWCRRIRLCAFDEDLQVLYLLVLPAGNIIAYSFETRRFTTRFSLNESVDNLLQLKILPCSM